MLKTLVIFAVSLLIVVILYIVLSRIESGASTDNKPESKPKPEPAPKTTSVFAGYIKEDDAHSCVTNRKGC